MGITANARYMVAWLIVNTLGRLCGFLVALAAFITMAVYAFAYWFSPELELDNRRARR